MTQQERIKQIKERAEGYYPPGVSDLDNIWQILKRQVFTSGALSMLPEIEKLESEKAALEMRAQYAEKVAFETSKDNANLLKRVKELEAQQSIKQFPVMIECPKCHTVQGAIVENTPPFGTFIHHCENCKYVIMESEWRELPPYKIR